MDELMKKLQIKKGQTGKIVHIPDDMQAALAAWSATTATDSGLDYIVVFVNNSSELQRSAAWAVQQLKDDGLLWFAYPKRSSGVDTDISRDHGWQPITDMGYRPVRQVSLSAVWSALRFREAARVQ